MGNTLLNHNVEAKNARLLKVIGDPVEAGYRLYRIWPFLDGKTDSTGDIRSMIVRRQACTDSTNPWANDTRHAGKFVSSSVLATDENGDGTSDRACAITEQLSKVKSVTTVADLGTPFKNADKATLNYLGFREGLQEHIYHKYTNLDPSQRATIMGLSPTETGYTIVFRKFETEKDQTGTFYVVFEKDTWLSDGSTAKWNTHKKRVARYNYDSSLNPDGFGFREVKEVTGLSKTSYDSAFKLATAGDTHRIVTRVELQERPNGEYKVTQFGARIYHESDSTGMRVTRFRKPFGGAPGNEASRTWFRRTDSARRTLMGPSGMANDTFTYNGVTFYPFEADASPDEDGSWTVTQRATEVNSGATALATYHTESWVERQLMTRTRDDKEKLILFIARYKCASSRHAIFNWVKNVSDSLASSEIVRGSVKVNTLGAFFHEGKFLTLRVTATNPSDWT